MHLRRLTLSDPTDWIGGWACGASFSEDLRFWVPHSSRFWFFGKGGGFRPSPLIFFCFRFSLLLTPDRNWLDTFTKLLTTWYSCDTNAWVVGSP
jgi:hypothetical protein